MNKKSLIFKIDISDGEGIVWCKGKSYNVVDELEDLYALDTELEQIYWTIKECGEDFYDVVEEKL